MDIAAGLAFLRPAEYWGIEAKDISNAYEYLKKYQDIPENPYAKWQEMRDMRMDPFWRDLVIWRASCNIKWGQELLHQSLLPVHQQSDIPAGKLDLREFLAPLLPAKTCH